MITRIVIATVLLGAALLAAVNIRAVTTTNSAAELQDRSLPVEVLTILPQPLQLSVTTRGTVQPATEAKLIPEVAGRVIEVSDALVAGGSFRAGDVLLRIDDETLRESLKAATATRARTQAELVHARDEHARSRKLIQQRLVSRADLERTGRAYRIAEANYQDSQVAYRQAALDVERAALRAPFDGFVRDEQVDVGQFVNRGTSVATIYANAQVEVRLPVLDRELALLDIPLGQPGELPQGQRPAAELFAEYGGQNLRWQGYVARMEAEIDAMSRTVQLVARVNAEDADFLPPVGLFVNAEIDGKLIENGIVLPRSAVRNDDVVLIVDNDNRLRFRSVVVERLDNDRLWIREGLAAGDRICLSPIATPVEGMNVTPLVAQTGTS